MIYVKKLFKSYKKRRLSIYDANKLIAQAYPFSGWYALSVNVKDDSLRKEIRQQIMQNLHWLLGQDCTAEEWKQCVEDWDKGKHLYNVPVDKCNSVFFDDIEKLTALASFNV